MVSDGIHHLLDCLEDFICRFLSIDHHSLEFSGHRLGLLIVKAYSFNNGIFCVIKVVP